MAKTRKKATDKGIGLDKFNITVLPIDRNFKTLEAWHIAIVAAEDIHTPVRKPLHDLYKNVVMDTHLTGVMDNQRLVSITNLPWMCVDANGKPIPEITKTLDTTFFEKILKYICESIFYGHSLMQIDWQARKVDLVPRTNVNPVHKLVLPNALNPLQGVAYNEPPYNGLILEVGEPDALGLLLKVAPWTILKRGDVGDWATFCEIFGMPLRVGYYDSSSPGNQKQVENSLKNMGAAGWLVLPDGSRVEFPSVGSTQGNDVYERFLRVCDEQISKAIVAQTMTTENGSSKAQGTVHLEVQKALFDADCKLVERVLNEQLIPLLITQGVSLPEGAKFKAAEEVRKLTAQQRLDMDLRIHKEVGKLPKAYFAEEYDVEFVDDSDEIEEPDEPNEPTEDPQPKKEKEKQKTTKKESLSLDDIPLHEQPLYIRLFDYIKSFFVTAPK